MNIVIFGSNGKVGSIVTQLLLDDGHYVRAVVYGNSQPEKKPHLEVVRADVHNPDEVTRAILGMDCVVSTLGSWGTKQKDILSVGMENIVPAMESASIQRIVSLTGSAAFDTKQTPTWWEKCNRFILGLFAKKIVDDAEKHIALLRSSRLEWTVLRSPVMTNKQTRDYALTNSAPAPWAIIPRSAVAQAIVDQVTATDYLKQAPFIKAV